MQLIFDFDGTITETDTISTLAQSALDYQQRVHGLDLSAPWTQVVKAYMNDLKEFTNSYEPPENGRTHIDQEVQFLKDSRSLEITSLQRIADSKVFTDIGTEELFKMGVQARKEGKIVFREGFAEMMELAEKKGWRTGIISVNWSRAFISGALHPLKVEVIANELSQDGVVTGPKCLGHELTSARGKRRVQHSHFSADTNPCVYFGDSPTDMQCMLSGGIALASDEDKSPLVKTFRRLGLNVPHVGDTEQWDGVKEQPVFWARNFREVLDSDVLSRLQE